MLRLAAPAKASGTPLGAVTPVATGGRTVPPLSLGRLVLPCALRGQYDLFVQARQSGALKLEAQAKHPHHTWPLLNHTHRVSIRTQNRVRKRQLIVKWERR